MEKSKKELKALSIVILVFAVVYFAENIIGAALDGFVIKDIPEGVSFSVAQAVYISVLVLSFLFILPDVYIGIKGIKAAKEPVKTKAHITWAKVLMVISIIAVISSVVEAFSSKDLVMDIISIADMTVNACLYYFYIKHATVLVKANKQ